MKRTGQCRSDMCADQNGHISNLDNAGAPAPAAGTKASIVTGFQQGDTSAAAHAIADSSPNGQASDALGQLYSSGQRQFCPDIISDSL